jgi:energy-coupling factor transporter ATP-binding protein EcfA2
MLKKSIILCGPNGSGKSTLGRTLSKILDLPYVHAGPDPGSFNNAIKACHNQLKNLESGCILDRCTPISRQIYTPGGVSPTEELVLNSFLELMMEQANIVYCTGEGEFTEKEYYPEGHFDLIVMARKSIREGYNRMFQKVPNATYNFSTDSITKLIDEVNKNGRT